VNKQQFRKLATVGAAAALSLQLLAGVASAAVPSADSFGESFGSYGGDGWAGFSTSLSYTDSSTLAKLYLEVDVTGGDAVKYFSVTKEGGPIAGNPCSYSSAPITIKCLFKTVRNGDDFNLTFAVTGASTATRVTATGGWSSTGFVLGGNNSHGDSWPLCDVGNPGCVVAGPSDATYDEGTIYLESVRDDDANHASGFGNLSLSTSGAFSSNNPQVAKLANLPPGKYASVNDAGANVGPFPDINIDVNGGSALDGTDTFQLVIVYPKGTNSPSSYEHVTSGQTYTACARNATKFECFDWSNKNNTVTLYLRHNGTLRRSG
jgi:hypothetical protein